MEVIETMRFVYFEALEQPEDSVPRGRDAAGQRKLRRCGSRSSERMYTEPCWEAQNGNPGAH